MQTRLLKKRPVAGRVAKVTASAWPDTLFAFSRSLHGQDSCSRRQLHDQAHAGIDVQARAQSDGFEAELVQDQSRPSVNYRPDMRAGSRAMAPVWQPPPSAQKALTKERSGWMQSLCGQRSRLLDLPGLNRPLSCTDEHRRACLLRIAKPASPAATGQPQPFPETAGLRSRPHCNY